jgi:glycosyltransferase involved in cell wall biosynthesis
LTVYRSLARHLGPRGVRFSAFAFDGWRPDTWWTFCDELIDGRSTTLAAVLASGRYDLVHCVDGIYSPPYGVEKWVRRARFKGPVVLMSQDARRHLTETAHATCYVGCSHTASEVLAQDADGPVLVIPNGYDEQVFQPGPAGNRSRPLLVWVGRSYDPQKDVDLFLEAVESLPDHDAVLVDTDPEATAVKNHLTRLGERVQHRAMLEPRQVADVYRAAALSGGAFVSTSRREGFGIAAIEAMACGCPVVAPQIGGHDHLVDGLNAIVYNRSSGISGIADAIDRLDDPALRAKLVDHAQREAMERWTSRAMADAYQQVYGDALARAEELGSQRLRDTLARIGWRIALAIRPTWNRARHLARW